MTDRSPALMTPPMTSATAKVDKSAFWLLRRTPVSVHRRHDRTRRRRHGKPQTSDTFRRTADHWLGHGQTWQAGTPDRGARRTGAGNGGSVSPPDPIHEPARDGGKAPAKLRRSVSRKR